MNLPCKHHRDLSVLISLLALTPAALPGQAVSATPSAATLGKYDTNKNGRLDPAELAAMEADQAKVPVAVTAGTAKADEGTVRLSPFEVKEANNGYYATSTMSGTRLNTKLEDLASSISIVTKAQMQDFAMLDINDIFAYESNTEGTGNYTAFEVDRNGMVTDQIQNNPQGANRIRGIGAANISLNGFASSGRVPIDPSNIDAVEISRGPNSSIFGLGEGSGTVNLVAEGDGCAGDRGGFKKIATSGFGHGAEGVALVAIGRDAGGNGGVARVVTPLRFGVRRLDAAFDGPARRPDL